MTVSSNLSGTCSRRQALRSLSAGFGYLAFAGLSTWSQQLQARSGQAMAGLTDEAGNPLAPRAPHFPARAKHVIFLSMAGAPSHVDTFDYKPSLQKDAGQKGRYGGGTLMGSPFQFAQHGQSGLWISELFPNLAKQADHLCLLRGMHSDSPNHPTAQTLMHTGNFQFVRPSIGAWTLYGLGTDNSSLPGFVSLNPPASGNAHYGSAFLPAAYQGTRVVTRGTGRGNANQRRRNNGNADSLPDIKNPRLNRQQQREQLDLIQRLNRQQKQNHPEHPGIDGAIESLELAFRMQDSMPELMDLSDESQETLDLYGAQSGATASFGTQCLLARRFVEAGVRFIQVSHGGWDHHNNLEAQLTTRCEQIDQPIAALLSDLERRGLLKETLVVWGGEFGRTPNSRNGSGRDHNNRGYTTWMAGGGVKGGFSYGETDEHGYQAVTDTMHTHDWHATILHLLGLDHQRLTYRYAGRDFRLTDVAGEVATSILA